MPLYEYECDECGHRFEVIQKFSDGPLEKCPGCGGHVRKLQSAPSFHFKGSGWYITDYARKEPAGKSDGDAQKRNGGPAPDAGEKKDSAASEKPADKSTGGEGASAAPTASADKDAKSSAKDSKNVKDSKGARDSGST